MSGMSRNSGRVRNFRKLGKLLGMSGNWDPPRVLTLGRFFRQNLKLNDMIHTKGRIFNEIFF